MDRIFCFVRLGRNFKIINKEEGIFFWFFLKRKSKVFVTFIYIFFF